jgi:hypothetical protein
MARDKFEEYGDSFRPELDKDDPYADLFAACTTPEEVLALQAEIDAAEASDSP